jgi:hypothetical protein
MLLALLAAGWARADEAPIEPLPVTEAAWDARDAEGRWVLYSEAQGAKPGLVGDPWLPFLAKRREWNFVEWIALSTPEPAALDALAQANAPQWVRCAVWRLSVWDGHAMGGSRRWLTETRPGLALAWLERFPAAAKGKAASLLLDLKAKDPPREDASALLPPLDLETVLADLRPPPVLEDWGERARAEPGRRYVHQVERTLAILEQRRDLEGEPWAGRLASLLGHAHPGVRRAAALAYAHREPAEIPVGLLAARVRDDREIADVRTAALLGLSYSDHPAAYGMLLRIAAMPAHPAWRAAVGRLADEDHGFAPEEWTTLDPAPAGPDAKAFLAEQAARIRERVAASRDAANEDASWLAREARTLLERAAWLELAQSPAGARLASWTTRTLRSGLATRGTRAALEALRKGYVPSFRAEAAPGPTAAATRDRVRSFAARMLAP